jgi:hypothetical protein
VVTEEEARLRDANAKLSQDLYGKWHGSLFSSSGLLLAPDWTLIHWPWLQGRA